MIHDVLAAWCPRARLETCLRWCAGTQSRALLGHDVPSVFVTADGCRSIGLFASTVSACVLVCAVVALLHV